MEISPGSVYCGNHQPLVTNVESSAVGQTSADNQLHSDGTVTRSSRRALKKAGRGPRIPCPLDPSHNIYRNNLESHLKICNESKKSTLYSSWPYYCQNCNGGESAIDSDLSTIVNVDALVDKLQRIYDSIECNLPQSVEEDSQCLESSQITAIDEQIRSEIGKDQTSFEQLRHVEQDIKIVHHMIAANLLQVQDASSAPSSDVFLEFGAGKGLLGYALYFADPSASIGLVERSSNRKKIDKFLLDRKASFERYKMDIRHCLLPQLPLVTNPTNGVGKRKVAVIAKHLCGVASDLAIRSLCHLERDSYRIGLALATCCHHACQFEDYVGNQWLLSLGINRAEFNVFKYWSSWASLDRTSEQRKLQSTGEPSAVPESADMLKENDAEDEEEEHSNTVTGREVPRPKNLNHQQLATMGRQIKRIIDYGRLLFMQNSLGVSSSRLIKYCDERLSPECMLLLANSS